MLRPRLSCRNSAAISCSVPSRNSDLNNLAGEVSPGISTPLEVHDIDRPLVDNTSDGNRVCTPIASAMNWSMDTVFRNPASPGRNADVSQVSSEAWPLFPCCSG